MLASMAETKSSARHEIARNRERFTETLDEIETHVSERVSSVKRRFDVAQYAREHPWPALSIAIALGALIGGSRADEKAAVASAAGAKRAARATADGAKRVAARLHRADSERGSAAARADAEPERDASKPGIGDRIGAVAGASFIRAIDRLLDEMRAASVQWGNRLASSGRGARSTTTAESVPRAHALVETREALAPLASDVVPVPSEMLPSEVDARADAVEALGGGTHEPPLAPGAGDLGARWA